MADEMVERTAKPSVGCLVQQKAVQWVAQWVALSVDWKAS